MSYENFLVPPTKECYECGKVLTQTTAKGTTVRCASLLGLQSGTKFTYRCRPCSILYKYDMYEKECKHYFYQQQRHFVRANDSMFIERKLLDEYVQLSLHSQVSFESFAVCYNAAFSDELDHCEKTFVASNADINDDDDNDVVLDEGVDVDCESDDEIDEEDVKGDTKIFGKFDMSRKHVSSGHWSYSIEQEMRIRKEKHGFLRPLNDSFNSYMEYVDGCRVNELYPHECSDGCRSRGCPYVTVYGKFVINYVRLYVTQKMTLVIPIPRIVQTLP